MAQYMMLGTVVVTVLDVVLLLANADIYVPYCNALAYYAVLLGKVFDNSFILAGTQIGEFTYTGMAVCFVVLAVLLVIWWLGKRSARWLKVAMGVVIADTVVLVAITLALFGEPISGLMEIVLHGAVIWEIWQGIKAQKQIDKLDAMQQQETYV